MGPFENQHLKPVLEELIEEETVSDGGHKGKCKQRGGGKTSIPVDQISRF